MRFVSHVIEQLDLAAQQLRHRTAAHSRFALILVDNAVELTLHRWCKHECRIDARRAESGRAKYSSTQRAEALGRHFDKKMRFCVNAKLISESQCDFIINCHSYRNDLYHIGMMHEELIEPIASEYYLLACELLLSHGRHSASMFSSRETFPEAVARHATEAAVLDSHNIHEILSRAVRSLRAAKPQTSRVLQVALSEDMLHRIQKISSALDILAEADSQQLSVDELILSLESHAAWLKHLESRADASTLTQSFELYHQERQKFEAAYKQTIFVGALERWRRRAEQLASEKDSHLALKKHETLRRESDSFAELASDAVAAFDDHIQQMVDEERGK